MHGFYFVLSIDGHMNKTEHCDQDMQFIPKNKNSSIAKLFHDFIISKSVVIPWLPYEHVI